jgi:hypothetical protein
MQHLLKKTMLVLEAPRCRRPKFGTRRRVSLQTLDRYDVFGMTFLFFSQNRNCIVRVALLRERVPRSAFGLQRSARTQAYPQ